jgi:hypothetical protein
MKQKPRWVWLILLPILFLFPLAVKAQSPALQLDTLFIEIWPEYDQPETLVIYRAELSPTTSLPAKLTFQLPGYIDNMHAVAIEQNGGLVEVAENTIEMRHEGNSLSLTFPTSSPRIQFEYYDPVILSKQDQTRQLTFQFSAPYNVETTVLQVQEPFQAQDFALTPEPKNSFTGRDGLKYHTIEIAGLTPADTFELAGTYNRDTDELSVQQVARNATNPPADTSVLVEPPANEVFGKPINWGYVLIGAGVVLLLGVGGYWWWSQQKQVEPEPPRRRSTRPGRRRKAKSPAASPASGGYCYRCGTVLREDAQFCHNCGAERRKG